MEKNHVVITGVVIEVESQRVSPAGVAHQRFMLQHRSRQMEAGQPREVFCRLLAELRGELVKKAQPLEVNDRIEVSGFLARSSYKDDTGTTLILHVSDMRKTD